MMGNHVYSSSDIFDLQANKVAFEKWNTNDPEYDYAFTKKIILSAVNEVLSEKQRLYFTMYHIDGLTVRRIAQMEGVNSGTVSRTLLRAAKKLHAVLRWSNPIFLNTPEPTRNRRIVDGG